MAQNFDGRNIDEFLSIRQHFPYQKFPLIISSAVCMPDHFFVQGVITSYSMRSHAILFPVHANMEKQCGYIAMRITVHIPNSKVALYIASN